MHLARARRLWIAGIIVLVATLLLGLITAVTTSAVVACGLDPAFGANGVVVSELVGTARAHGVAVRPNGSVVVAGSISDEMTATQYGPTGALDPSFGTGGVVTISHDAVFDSSAADVALQPDGKAILAGIAFWAVSESSWGDIAVARLNPDGTRDASFGGGDGVVYIDLKGHWDEVDAVALDGAGRIVLAGRSKSVSGNSDALIVRLRPDGRLDSSFGKKGVVVLDLGSNYDIAYGLALGLNGTLLVAGNYQPIGSTPWLARLRTNGHLDRRFGQKGLVLHPTGGAWYDVTVQADGRVVTAGEELSELAVARYLPNGTADRTFGTGGVATVRVDPTGDLNGRAWAVASRADGTIFAVGDASTTNVSDLAAVALLPSGTPDARFGSGGLSLRRDPAGWPGSLQDVGVLPNGSALAVGHIGWNNALARYTLCG